MQRQHRAEHLAGRQDRVRRQLGQHGRGVGRALAGAAGEQLRALGHRVVHPGPDPLRRVLVDQRADVRGVVVRVTGDLLGHLGDDLLHQRVVDRGVGDHALHRDAGLAALVVGEHRDPGGRPVQVRLGGPVGEHHGRGVAAQLQGGVLARHRVHDLVADLVRTGEGDHRQPRVLHQGRHPVVRDRQNAPGTGRQVGLGQDLAQHHGRQRGRRGRLEDDRRADRDRRGDLVGDQVQREVERGDAQHHAAREAAHQRETAHAARVGVQPHGLAVGPAGLLGGPAEHRDGTADLAAGPLDRLAVLRGDQPGDLLGALGQAPGHVVQGGGPHVRRGRGEHRQRGDGGLQGLLDLRLGGNADLADQAAVPAVVHLEVGIAARPAAGQPEIVRGGHRGTGLSSSSSGPHGRGAAIEGRAADAPTGLDTE